MIELGLVVVTSLLGLSFALVLSRGLRAAAPAEAHLRQLAHAVRAATAAFHGRASRTGAAIAALTGAGAFLAYGLLRTDLRATVMPPLVLGVGLAVTFACGVLAAIVVTRVAVALGGRGALAVGLGLRRGVDQALSASTRAGAVVGIFAVTVGLLGSALIGLGLFAYEGGFSEGPGHAIASVPFFPFVAAGYPLGAAVIALLFAVGGGVFAKAADVGADLIASEVDLAEDDTPSPLTVPDLAGDVMAGLAGPAAALFAVTLAVGLGASIVGGQTFRENPGLPSVFALSLFPFIAGAFGVLASAFGVMVVKTDDREDPRSALVRGFYVTIGLFGVSLAGAAKWLLGPHWIDLMEAGLLGLSLSALALHAAQYVTEARFRPVRALGEASRGGGPLVLLGGLSTGLGASLVFAAALAATLVGSYFLGLRTELVGGGFLGVVVAAVGLVGPTPYVLALAAVGPAADGARAYTDPAVDRMDVRSRALILDGVGATTKAFTRTFVSLAEGLSAAVLVVAFLVEARVRLPEGAVATPFGQMDGVALPLAVALGAGLMVAVGAEGAQAVARSARRVLDEARRQLRGRSAATSSEPALPDPRACLEALARAGLRAMLLTGVAIPIVLVAFGLGLRFLASGDNGLRAVDAVGALVSSGAFAGIFGSIALGSAGATWDGAKKHIVSGAHGGRHLIDEAGARRENPTYRAAALGDSLGDALRDVASPSLAALVGLLSVTAIVFLPFFI